MAHPHFGFPFPVTRKPLLCKLLAFCAAMARRVLLSGREGRLYGGTYSLDPTPHLAELECGAHRHHLAHPGGDRFRRRHFHSAAAHHRTGPDSARLFAANAGLARPPGPHRRVPRLVVRGAHEPGMPDHRGRFHRALSQRVAVLRTTLPPPRLPLPYRATNTEEDCRR